MEIILETGVTLKSINCFIDDGSFSYIKDPAKEKQIALPEELKTKAGKFHTRK